MLVYDIIPPDKLKRFAKENILGIRDYKTKSKKYFAFGWRIVLLFFVILYFFSGLTPIEFFQKSISAIKGTETRKVNLYTTSCLSDSFVGGIGWQNPDKATGVPDVDSSGDINSFSETNSAIYQTGLSELICQSFVEQTEVLEHQDEDFTVQDTTTTEMLIPDFGLPTEETATTTSTTTQSIIPVPEDISTTTATSTQDLTQETRNLATNTEDLLPEASSGNQEEIPIDSTSSDSNLLSSFFDNAQRFFRRLKVWAQSEEKIFKSAKIKLSFTISGKQKEIEDSQQLLENRQPEMENQGEDNTTSSEETISFWNKIENYFKSLTVSAEETKENVSTTESISENTSPADEVMMESETVTAESTTTSTTTIDDFVSQEIITTTTETAATSSLSENLFSSNKKIIIWYSIDGKSWWQLDVISDYPLSNYLNGGYFEYEAPFLKNWQDIENLRIKFEGVNENDNNIIAYLDAVWVEAEYYKEEVSTDSKEYSLELISEKKDFKIKEIPSFRFRYKEKRNLIQSVGAAVMSVFRDEYKDINIKVNVLDFNGKETTEFVPIIQYEENGEFSIDFSQSFRQLKPGKYKLRIVVENGLPDLPKITEFEQDFTWGVLAINTNKSIYVSSEALAKEGLPPETAYIQMAALRDDGHTICDAKLRLEIVSPDNKTVYPEIQKSGKCWRNNVTQEPDYFSYYQTKGLGTYQMKLVNLDNGYEISDSFEVRESVSFDVERIGPTRIYPPVGYEMVLKIKANQDFEGQIIETVPSDFDIKSVVSSSTFQVSGGDNLGENNIIWNVDIREDDYIELSYIFDAPDISPYLYLLGPLQINSFQEIRQWQIASDAIAILGEATSTAAHTTTTSSYVLLNGMTSTVTIEGTGSHVLFHGMASFNTDSGDASCYLGLFIDSSMVAEGKDYVDAIDDEEGSVSVAWWKTGLSPGPHIFELRLKEDQADCVASTDEERSMQVIEFKSSDVAAEILSEIATTSAETTVEAGYTLINGMTTSTDIAGTGSVVMFNTTVTTECGTCDSAADIALFIDNSMVAEASTASDAADEEGSVTLTWWETGLSTGPHIFDVRWRENDPGAPIIAIDTQRHMQVVEFTGANAPTILSEATSTSVHTTTTASYIVVNDMTVSPTIAGTDSVVITTGVLTFNGDGGNTNPAVFGAIFIDGSMVVEQENFVDDDPEEPDSVGLMWAETGLSPGSHIFDLRFKEDSGKPDAIIDTSVQRHLQVVEFASGVVADITVSATSTQVSSLDIPSTNNYVGGAFVITNSSTTSINVTDILITENGSVDAQNNLDNIALYYDLDTASPYDCSGESFGGGESQFGATNTDGFSSENGTSTFNGSVSITTITSMCVYVLLDVTSSATTSDTLEIKINNPSNDVTVSAGTVVPGSAVELSGTTNLYTPTDLQQLHYRWRYDNGEEDNISSIQATATADITTTSNTYVLADGMTITPGAGDYHVWFSSTIGSTADYSTVNVALYLNGVFIDHTERDAYTEAAYDNKLSKYPVATHVRITGVTAGQAIEARWKTDIGTATMRERTLLVEKITASNSWQATATADISTTSATYVVADGMTTTTAAGDYHVWFSSSVAGTTGNSTQLVSLFLDGTKIDHTERQVYSENSMQDGGQPPYFPVATHARITGVTEGQVIDVRWNTDAGIATMRERTLLVEKITASNSWQATATADISTTSATYVVADGMTTTTAAGDYHVWFSSSVEGDTGDTTQAVSLFLDGTKIAHTEREIFTEGSIPDTSFPIATHALLSDVTEGQVIDVRWQTSGGIATMHERTLVITKVPVLTGASFILDEDQGLADFITASTTRLRFLISNEGGLSTTTAYQLEVAKNPTCSSGSYSAVPTNYSGHWHIATSTYITDGESTSNIKDQEENDALTDPGGGAFENGELRDESNTTGNITLDGDDFTEIEFSILAVDGSAEGGAQYCFRLTSGGSDSNFTYTIYATSTIVGTPAPNIILVSLNNTENIDLTENTTTFVTSTATVSDSNGWEDIIAVGGRIFRSGVSLSCNLDDNNCYEDTSCATSSCSGTSCTAICEFNIQFHADPTVTGTPWDSQYWVAWMQATDTDSQTGSATNTDEMIEMNDLVALDVEILVYYGDLYPGTTTDPLSTTTQVINTGNCSLDVTVYGINMTSGGNSILVGQQRYSTSSLAFAAASVLQLSPGQELELNLAKTTDSGSKQTTDMYWGIQVPDPQAVGDYSGQNTLSAQKNELPW